MSATSLKAVCFLLAPAEVGERMAERTGPRCSAIEVLAHDAIEVKNVVRAKGAAWSLKTWFDLSSDNSAGGVEGGSGGQRIAFRRPHS